MAIFKFSQKPNMNLCKRIWTSLWSSLRCRRKSKQEQKPYELYERLPGWYELYVEFTNRTTWHGLKYPCLPTRFKLRSIIWTIVLLTNATLFVYIMTTKMIDLKGYPTSVNVEVTYVDSVPLPAITICNQNLYRLTAVQERGLYDYLVNTVGNSSAGLDYCDVFHMFTGICRIPGSFRSAGSDGTRQVSVYHEVTRSACLSLCVFVNDDTCSGVLYDRGARTCEVSPYTGEWVEAAAPLQPNCSATSQMEFYRRTRCNTDITFRCDFEDNYCPLSNDTTQKDQWTIVEADRHLVLTDNTLNLGSGHFLNLLMTDRRLGYKARVKTPYLNTTNKCLELFYWLQTGEPGYSEYPTLSVSLVDEERQEQLISTVRKGPKDWNRLFIRLPEGIYRVVIEGQRGNIGLSGISVDDVSLLDCAYFDANKECKSTRLGKDYVGSASVTAEGGACLPWEALSIGLISRLPDSSPEAAASFCRNIPQENWTMPSCFIELSSGNLQRAPCNIPYCECYNSSYFRCDNGMCLPRSLLCNGVDDCLDNSDELRACSDRRQVECRFETDYKCGYTTTSLGDQQWTRLSSSALSYLTGNILRSSVSALEQLMVIDSKLGQFGDQVQLVSPLWTFDQPIWVDLTYIMMPSSQPKSVAGFYLYQLSEVHSPIRQLFNVTSFDNNELMVERVCVPNGTYHFMFLGVQGVPYDSAFGLDIVTFREPCNHTFEPIVESVNCSFVSPCGYQFISTSSYFSSAITYYNNAFDNNKPVMDKCSENATGIEGTILSPGYSDGGYPAGLSSCVYNIIEPEGTRITITFVEFNIAPDDDCHLERLEIRDLLASDGVTRIYCGDTLPPAFVSEGHQVAVTFKTHRAATSAKFKLSYTTQFSSVNAGDYILVMKYTETPPHNFNYHYARLISPAITIATNSCLSLTIVANANVTIRSFYTSEARVPAERHLFSSGLPLGPTWTNLRIDLSPSPTSEKFAVAIETAISTTDIVAAAISDIKMHDGTCRQLVANGSLECVFEDIQQCGYLDESSGSVNWARVHDRISNQYYMRAVFSKTARDEAILRSAVVTINSTKCLRINVFSSSSALYVSVASSNSGHQAADRYQLSQGSAHVASTLDPGTFSVEIKVSYPREVLDDSNIEFSEARIYSIVLNDGQCNSVAPVANSSCDFDDDFACDYQPVTNFGDPWSWVSFQSLTKLNLHLLNATTNSTRPHNNVMLFNGSSTGREGVLISPPTDIDQAGQLLTFEVIASSSLSTYLEVYVTNALDHVSTQVLSISSFSPYDWNVTSVCLPRGTYKLAFVAYTTVDDYVAIDNVLVTSRPCDISLPSNTDCEKSNPLSCSTSVLAWSPKFDWMNISDVRKDSVHTSSYECARFFYALQGNFTYNETAEKSSSVHQCSLYIRGIGKFTVTLEFFQPKLRCDAFNITTLVKIYRRENGMLHLTNMTCSDIVNSSSTQYSFATEDILQIHVSRGEDSSSYFIIKYSYAPEKMTGYSLALYYNTQTAVSDVTVQRMAEWASPILTTQQDSAVCLMFDHALAWHATLEVRLLARVNRTLENTVIFSSSGSDPRKDTEDLWRMSIFQVPLELLTNRVQFVFYLSVSNASFRADEAFIGALRNFSAVKGPCGMTGSVSKHRANIENDFSFFDSSVNDSSRWVRVSKRFESQTSGSCKVTVTDDYGYTGNVSHTVSGRTCQRWDQQVPHAHYQNVSSYFPDKNINDSANYCRNPNNPFIPRTAWCYTMEADQKREYCDIPLCLDYFYRVEFSSQTISRAILTPPKVTLGKVSCLRFIYQLTSTRVRLTVDVLSDAATSVGHTDKSVTYFIEFEPTSDSIVWSHGEVDVTSTSSKVQFYADKIDVTDGAVFVSVDNVTVTDGPCQQKVVDNSSNTNSRVAYDGPRIAYSSFADLVLKDMFYVDMQNVTSVLAHQMEQLVHQCEFIVDDCSQVDAFKTQFTDLGQCYTFNFNESDIMVINSTGSKSGLRLTLNIEQYEHIPEFGLGVGAKLYLHDQIEVPNMRNLGLSFPTAMHTLVSVTYTNTQNMEPPYGKCGAANLSYYPDPDTEPYTESKCLLQDKSNYYVAMCGCKDIYMPGPNPVCSFPGYFQCVYTSIQDHKVAYTSECPPACTINSYSVEMSQAQLPGLDIKKLYGDKAQDIETRYLHALEIRNRVDESQITTTISLLQEVIDATTLLKNYIYFGALDPATSFPVHVQAAITHSGQLITSDITSTGRRLLSTAEAAYDSKLKPSVSYLTSNVRSLYSTLSFGKDVLASMRNPGWQRPSEWYSEFFNETQSRLRRMNDALEVFQPMIKPGDVYLPRLFESEVCSRAINDLTLQMADIADRFSNFTIEYRISENATSEVLIVKMNNTLGVLATVDNCTQQYEKLLNDFEAWLEALQFSASNTTQTKTDEILVMFNDITDWLVQLRDNYSRNAIKKKDLAIVLLSDQSISALQRIDNVIQEISQQVVAPIQNRIDSDESEASASYYQLLKYLARFYNFTSNDNIEDNAKSLMIWREPVHNLDVPETTIYRLDPDEVWQVWPSNENLVSFVTNSAATRLDLVCHEYFDPLHRKLSIFLSEMNNRQSQVSQTMTSIQTTLKGYLDSTALDETFAMKNFMVIDIYYGELKYEQITQSDSYSWTSFFSDMGSFFGLLMGCSILTMIEVIDLVVYYSIVKLIERYEERPLRQEVIDIKI